MIVRVYQSRRVRCEATLDLPISVSRAWGQLRDFHRYAAHDHFHAAFWIEGGIPRAGARLLIEHRFGPFRTRRCGRILRWREGNGYAFSDLSMLSPRAAFPHVLELKLTATGDARCQLRVRVGGRWTARTPRWMARLWLWWVFIAIVQRTRNNLAAYALMSNRHLSAVRPSPAIRSGVNDFQRR